MISRLIRKATLLAVAAGSFGVAALVAGDASAQATVAQIEGNVTELKNVALTNSSSSEEIAATMIQLSKQSDLMRQRLAEFGTT